MAYPTGSPAFVFALGFFFQYTTGRIGALRFCFEIPGQLVYLLLLFRVSRSPSGEELSLKLGDLFRASVSRCSYSVLAAQQAFSAQL
jgi:hypothetical protein